MVRPSFNAIATLRTLAPVRHSCRLGAAVEWTPPPLGKHQRGSQDRLTCDATC